MTGFTKIVAAALVAATTLPLIGSPSDAATVRRHLRCSIGPTITLPTIIIGSISSTPFVITNQWSFDIPKNTTYTLTVVGHKSWTVKNTKVLPAGESFAVNTNYSDGTCIVSVPG